MQVGDFTYLVLCIHMHHEDDDLYHVYACMYMYIKCLLLMTSWYARVARLLFLLTGVGELTYTVVAFMKICITRQIGTSSTG